jgi:uncharacterized RDD family membrane protein YckC
LFDPPDDRIARERTARKGEVGGGAAVERAKLERRLRAQALGLATSAANEILELLPRLTSLADERVKVHEMGEFDYDDRLTITTPEGVELSLTLAGVGSRFMAAIVDALIESVILLALGLVVFLSGGFGGGQNVASAIFAVVFFAVFWGYDIAFEVLASGRTPGKRRNGIRVVRTGGQPIGFLASATRNLLRVIDFLPSAYLVGIISIFVSSKNQRLGDIVAGTVIVRELRADAGSSATGYTAPVRTSSGVTWDVSAITAEEIAAVRSFLERRYDIAPDARFELATTMAGRLRPKVAGVADDVSAEPFLELLVRAKAERG